MPIEILESVIPGFAFNIAIRSPVHLRKMADHPFHFKTNIRVNVKPALNGLMEFVVFQLVDDFNL